MKMKFNRLALVALLQVAFVSAFAQTNIFPASGNTGIGTLTPAEKLSVVTATSTTGITHSDGIIKIGTFVGGSGGSLGGFLGTLSNHPLYLRTNNSIVPQVALLQSGFLGIGTPTPLGMLDVRGDAYINGIRAGRGGSGSSFQNTCFGEGATSAGAGGRANTAIGYFALRANQYGEDNTAVGNESLKTNYSGGGNAAFGSDALSFNYNGSNNSAMGQWSLFSNNSGNANTASGFFSLFSNTTGSENTAIGNKSLDSNTTGKENSAMGTYSMHRNKTGNYNTSIGRYSLYNNSTGFDNTAVGDVALYYNTTGSLNTAIGDFATPNAGGLINTTAIGYNATTTASNQVRIGNSAVTSIGGYVNWTNISDGRVKKNIKENVPGLSFINQLKPVTYNLNLDAADKITGKLALDEKIKASTTAGTDLAAAAYQKEQIVYSGFIAQDVEKAAQSLKYDFSGVDAAKNDKDLYGLRYAEFVVPLVKSVQELCKLNEEKDAKINDLQKQIDELRRLITSDKKTAVQNETITAASLDQNTPNPFKNATTISYTLPENYVSAKIIISDKTGKTIKTVNISGSGKGSVQINTAAMNAGTYQYSMYANGSLIETKQMIIVR